MSAFRPCKFVIYLSVFRSSLLRCLTLHEQLRPPPKGASFESFYLQAVTREFADDIDKVRNASDFKDSSLPILIEALRQGVGIYGEDERQRVMGRGK